MLLRIIALYSVSLSSRMLKFLETSVRVRIFSSGFLHLLKTSPDLCLTVARTNLKKYMYCLQLLSLC